VRIGKRFACSVNLIRRGFYGFYRLAGLRHFCSNLDVDSLAGPFEPEKYRDTYRERLEALIAAKVQGQGASPAETPKANSRVADLVGGAT
jgi:hypothetical protein